MRYHACCEHCAEPFQSKWPARFCSRRCSTAARTCTPEFKAKNNARVQSAAAAKRAEDGPRSLIYVIVCEFCNEPATLRYKRKTPYCNKPECRRAFLARRQSQGGWSNTYTARRRNVIKDSAKVEPVNRWKIFERDGWVCGICRGPVDKSLKSPDQAAPSLDHVVPVSLDGDHAPDNVRLAHLGCNIRRGNRIELDHLAIADEVIRTCMDPDCVAEHYALGYCLNHYGDSRYRGTITTQSACSEFGCDRRRVSRGYCKRHYESHFDLCEVDDCGRRRLMQGRCSRHHYELHPRPVRAPKMTPVFRRGECRGN